ncbi:MAG: type III pantothenate kinase [Thermodesulfobacteriota bacterium]
MLLVIDIGNTNIVIGIFDGKRLLKNWRIKTDKTGDNDKYRKIFIDLFQCSNINHNTISGAIISCVVPPVQQVFCEALKGCLGIKPLIVDPMTKIGVPILYKNPEEVGADRIVNAVAGFEKYKDALIIVDFGTATTFDYISPKGEYVGGAIAPGIMLSLDTLSSNASMLPSVKFLKPDKVIGRDTVSSMQSGIFYGYISLVDGMIERIKKEVEGKPMVIATGGLASVISSKSRGIDKVEENLTLEGLRIIYERNRDHSN